MRAVLCNAGRDQQDGRTDKQNDLTQGDEKWTTRVGDEPGSDRRTDLASPVIMIVCICQPSRVGLKRSDIGPNEQEREMSVTRIGEVQAKEELTENLSYAVHSRALVKFLYSSKSRPTDAIAEDFFVNPDIWINACPTIPKELTYENFVKFANKQIVHIVYNDENKHIWNFTTITDALQPMLEKFIGLVKLYQLGDRWLSLLENQTETQ